MPQIQLGDDVSMSNGVVIAYQAVTGTHSITLTSNGGGNEYVIGANTTSAAVTINLPEDGSRELGRMYYIVDSHGNAHNNNITIEAGTNATINGNSNFVVNGQYESVTVVCVDITTDAEKWMII